MFGEEKIQTGGNNVFAFVGGFIGAMTHYIASIRILLSLKVEELFDYTVHSLIGGLVMLAVKLAGDGIVYLIKKYALKKANEKITISESEVQAMPQVEKTEEKLPETMQEKITEEKK
jgi:hypothetical protein